MLDKTGKQASAPNSILLAFPVFEPGYRVFGEFEPLALEILVAIAKEEGIKNIDLIDERWNAKGMERIHRKGKMPDIIALTSHGYSNIDYVNASIRRARRLWPQSVIVLGGGQSTVTPDFFAQECLDYLVIGPGEEIWRSWCRNAPSRQSSCRIVQQKNVDPTYHIPTPDRGCTERYRRHYCISFPRTRAGSVVLTQGCPHRCTFCIIWKGALGKYRVRPVGDIVEDLRAIDEELVYIADDNTFANPAFAEKLALAIRDAGISKRFITYGRSDQVVQHPELFELWKKIGLEFLTIGVESVDDDILKKMNKKTSVDTHRKALRIIKRIGINSVPHFLITPDMAEQDFDKIKAFIREEQLDFPVIIPLTPVPGTEDFDFYLRERRLLTLDQRFYTFAFNVTQPQHGSIADHNRRYDNLLLWVWSWKRYFHDRCGGMSLAHFLGRWLMIRIYIQSLKRGRRLIEKDSKTQIGVFQTQRSLENLQLIDPAKI